MYSIENSHIFEQIINKSRFICYLFPVCSVDEANLFLQNIKKKHYDANHNCYAYIIGKNQEVAKNSDDGEPSKTAGVVIYDVLKKNNLTNILAIVTRYFGGIKLGASGLIRAYGSSVSKALENIQLKKIETYVKMRINYDYQYNQQIDKIIINGQDIKKTYSDNIECEFLIIIEEKESLIENLINITKNSIKIVVDDDI